MRFHERPAVWRWRCCNDNHSDSQNSWRMVLPLDLRPSPEIVDSPQIPTISILSILVSVIPLLQVGYTDGYTVLHQLHLVPEV